MISDYVGRAISKKSASVTTFGNDSLESDFHVAPPLQRFTGHICETFHIDS